ncbi:MAG: hypothetical protein JW959_14890 [Pirellulales bacterium]|nr:hypothetical protein [Pirellulales bacterium]
MRRIRETMLPFTWNNNDLPKTVREYREKYKAISRILDDHPEILKLVHEDLKRFSRGGRRGREGDFTSETILRALAVHAIEGLSLRETMVRIAENEILQAFLRTRKKATMDFTFLDKCFQAIRPATWKKINAALAQGAVESKAIDPSTIRTDTRAAEMNIHWPTDASLLWDAWRVAARMLRRGRAIAPDTCPHRFHDRKTKRLYLFITRYAKSENARWRQMRDLAAAVPSMWRSPRFSAPGTCSINYNLRETLHWLTILPLSRLTGIMWFGSLRVVFVSVVAESDSN